MKYSRKREAIYQAITATTSHPNADWVYATLKPDYPDLSLATVYRNIALFREQGRVALIATVNGQERFDGNVAPHAHFICSRCGCVLDIDAPKIQANELPGAPGARIDSWQIHCYGLCGPCCHLVQNGTLS